MKKRGPFPKFRDFCEITVAELLWRWRIRNRFALAWWVFRNPDNLTMLRHDMDAFRQELENNDCPRFSHQSVEARLGWWLRRFFDLPVR